VGQGNVYLPIFFLGLLAFGFAVFSVAAASFTGPKRYNRAKVDAYECGIQPAQAQLGSGRFPVKYYITAMLFIIFDIEIVFLFNKVRQILFDEIKTSCGEIAPVTIGIGSLLNLVPFHRFGADSAAADNLCKCNARHFSKSRMVELIGRKLDC
jgi:NADH-quinone oxidoreductase subunit A